MSFCHLEGILRQFLEEDHHYWDITTELIPATPATGLIKAKSTGILAGTPFAAQIFQLLGASIVQQQTDGTPINKGDIVLHVKGREDQLLI